jgi:hypothetical protein
VLECYASGNKNVFSLGFVPVVSFHGQIAVGAAAMGPHSHQQHRSRNVHGIGCVMAQLLCVNQQRPGSQPGLAAVILAACIGNGIITGGKLRSGNSGKLVASYMSAAAAVQASLHRQRKQPQPDNPVSNASWLALSTYLLCYCACCRLVTTQWCCLRVTRRPTTLPPGTWV